MIRISGVNIPDEKRVVIALTYVHGIGRTRSQEILRDLEIDPSTRTKDVSVADASRLREEIEKRFRVEGELKHEVKMNIRRLKDIGAYRGSRHSRGLPARGQRTKTNNRTVRGNKRMTMGSGRRTSEKT